MLLIAQSTGKGKFFIFIFISKKCLFQIVKLLSLDWKTFLTVGNNYMVMGRYNTFLT